MDAMKDDMMAIQYQNNELLLELDNTRATRDISRSEYIYRLRDRG